MSYPIIKNINDLLPYVKDREEFSIKEYPEGYTTIDYIYNDKNTFSNEYLRECRGIKFHTKTGEILARPFHKFFNLNEVEETKVENIDWDNQEFEILEKVDGSLIIPMILDDVLYFTTRAGITNIAKECFEWVSNNKPEYIETIIKEILDGYTPLFEWCSRNNRVVIDYGPEPKLKSLTSRSIITGDYYLFNNYNTYDNVDFSCIAYQDISIELFIDHTKNLVGKEGYVIYFSDGLLIKIKSDDYVLKHKVKSYFDFEKDVFSLIVQQKSDDFIPLLSPIQKVLFEEYKEVVLEKVIEVNKILNSLYEKVINDGCVDKKEYAVKYVNTLPMYLRSIMFSKWNESDKNIFDIFIDYLVKNCSTNSKFKELKQNLHIEKVW